MEEDPGESDETVYNGGAIWSWDVRRREVEKFKPICIDLLVRLPYNLSA